MSAVVARKPWDLSCPDWEARLRARRSLVPDLPLWPEGNRAVAIFDKLRLADVTGTPTMAEAGGDWFRDIVRAMFGSVDPETGDRMIREFFALVPKKNSKTTNGALLMLTALLMNRRPRAPMGLAAPVQDTAEIAFNAIAGAIDLDPVLDKKLHVRHHLKKIVHRDTKATLEVMTFDPSALTGPKWAAFLLDEIHEVSKRHKAAAALRQVRGGMLPYPEAFLGMITTQSEDPPAGMFHAELQRARGIRDGTLVGATLPILYEFPEAMQTDPAKPWRDPQHWDMVTPNVGRSLSIVRLVEEMAAEEAKGEGELRAWASQHLNVEIGLALHAARWPGADHWEACGDPTLTLDALIKRSEVITAGIDGGGLDDLLALTFIGREEGTGKWLIWSHAWAHPQVLERHKAEASRFANFEADGDLTLVKEIGDDIEELAGFVKKVEDSGLLDRVGVDPAGIGMVVDALTDPDSAIGPKLDPTPQVRIAGIPQGWKLIGAIKATERKAAGGEIVHSGSRMMAWCVGNAKVEPRGNAAMITKQGSGSAKIDPLMSTFDAGALMAMNPKPRKKKFQMFVV